MRQNWETGLPSKSGFYWFKTGHSRLDPLDKNGPMLILQVGSDMIVHGRGGSFHISFYGDSIYSGMFQTAYSPIEQHDEKSWTKMYPKNARYS